MNILMSPWIWSLRQVSHFPYRRPNPVLHNREKENQSKQGNWNKVTEIIFSLESILTSSVRDISTSTMLLYIWLYIVGWVLEPSTFPLPSQVIHRISKGKKKINTKNKHLKIQNPCFSRLYINVNSLTNYYMQLLS